MARKKYQGMERTPTLSILCAGGELARSANGAGFISYTCWLGCVDSLGLSSTIPAIYTKQLQPTSHREMASCEEGNSIPP